MELLIVIVVIGILAAITIVAYSGIQNRAKASSAQSAASQAVKKVAAWSVQNSDTYPASLADAGISDSGGTTYQYTVNNAALPRTFCVTATTQNVSYYASSANNTPTSGGCPGHGVGGVAAVTNQFMNPRFLGPVGPSSYANVTNLQIVDIGGTRFAQGEATSTSASSIRLHPNAARWNIGPGQSVFSRVTVRNPNAATRNFSLALRFSDASNGIIATNSSDIVAIPPGGTQVFTVSESAAPPNTTTVMITVLRNSGGAVGDLIQATNVWLSDIDAQFATGDSPNWVWNGTPNDSTSTGPPL